MRQRKLMGRSDSAAGRRLEKQEASASASPNKLQPMMPQSCPTTAAVVAEEIDNAGPTEHQAEPGQPQQAKR